MKKLYFIKEKSGKCYLIDKSCKITVPILPFSEIEKRGAKMYKGISGNSSTVERQSNQTGGGVQFDLAAQKSKITRNGKEYIKANVKQTIDA